MSYIAGITKLINAFTELIDESGSFNDFSNFDKSFQSHIQNTRDLTTKIIGSESDDNIDQQELEICSEHEFRAIQIRNVISSYFENKDVSPITLNKETNSPTLDVVSQSNSLSKFKASSQIEKDVLLIKQTLNTKIKAKSCHRSISSESSSKSSSKSSSSSPDTYLSNLRSSHQRCSIQKGVLRNFTKLTGNHLCQSLFFNKVAGLRLASLLKKGPWHR